MLIKPRQITVNGIAHTVYEQWMLIYDLATLDPNLNIPQNIIDDLKKYEAEANPGTDFVFWLSNAVGGLVLNMTPPKYRPKQ